MGGDLIRLLALLLVVDEGPREGAEVPLGPECLQVGWAVALCSCGPGTAGLAGRRRSARDVEAHHRRRQPSICVGRAVAMAHVEILYEPAALMSHHLECQVAAAPCRFGPLVYGARRRPQPSSFDAVVVAHDALVGEPVQAPGFPGPPLREAGAEAGMRSGDARGVPPAAPGSEVRHESLPIAFVPRVEESRNQAADR